MQEGELDLGKILQKGRQGGMGPEPKSCRDILLNKAGHPGTGSNRDGRATGSSFKEQKWTNVSKTNTKSQIQVCFYRSLKRNQDF